MASCSRPRPLATALAIVLLALVPIPETGDRPRRGGATARRTKRIDIARDDPRRRGRARALRAHLLHDVQQLPGRRVHGPDGRLRPLAGLRAGLGGPVGVPEPELHPGRALHREEGPGRRIRCGPCSATTSSPGRSASSSRSSPRSCSSPWARSSGCSSSPSSRPSSRRSSRRWSRRSASAASSASPTRSSRRPRPVTAFLIGPIAQLHVHPVHDHRAPAST